MRLRLSVLLSASALLTACADERPGPGSSIDQVEPGFGYAPTRLVQHAYVPAAGESGSLAFAPAEAAVAFVVARGDRFGITGSDELAAVREETDRLGMTHIRIRQVKDGVPVVGGDLIVHLDAAGEVTLVQGSTVADLSLVSTTPTVSAGAARRGLTRALKLDGLDVDATPELVIVAGESEDRLVWRTRTLVESANAEPVELEALVDAHTGEVLSVQNLLRTGKPPTTTGSVTGPATGTGNTLYSGAVTIHSGVWSAGGFALQDPTRGNARTLDMKSRQVGGTLYKDADNTWGTGTTLDGQSAAADAHFGFEKTYDYYLTQHGREGIDGANNATLPSGYAYNRVHYGKNYANAFWSDSCGCMTYGDGNGGSVAALVSLDIAGHEQAHGVTSRTADLNYTGESGGLNESMSDVFGEMVELYARGTNDWKIGAEVWTPSTPGDALRYFETPSDDGTSPDAWYAGIGSIDVHYSSGPANRCFYLLANGGAGVTGVGTDAASAIWYRALTVYFTSTTDYHQARTGTLAACADLYGAGSATCTDVDAAWAAISVVP